MMRWLLAGILAVAAPVAARAETIILSLSSHQVRITQTYGGTDLVVFGAILRDRASVARQGPLDIVITARGPAGVFSVRRKVQVGPVWVNLEQRKFGALPATIAVLASRPLDEIAPADLRERYRIGIEALVPRPGFGTSDDVQFRAALLRLRQENGLYAEEDRGVTFIAPDVFRASIPVPATAPVGNYEVTAALLADGVQLAQETTSFEVRKTGFESFVSQSSRDWPWLYGLVTSAIAVAMGLLASVVFRRD